MKTTKRLIAIVLCFFLVITTGISVLASGIIIQVNGNVLTLDQPPIIEGGRTLVPLRAIFEALGAEVEWNVSTQTVTAMKDNITVTLKIGSNILTRNEEQIRLDVPAQIVGDRTLVPARAIAESFGAEVSWSQNTQTMAINTTGHATAPSTIALPPTTGMHYKFTNTQERLYESFRKTRWETLIEITNTGTVPIYFGSSKYDLTDASGTILRAGNMFSSFPDILHPGEKGYLYDSIEVPGITVNSKVKMTPRWDFRQSKENRINFNLSEIEIRSGQFGTTVYGKIANNTGKEQTWALISIVLYSKDGTPIGIWTTNVMETMPVGANFGFEISGIGNRTLFDDVTPDMVDSYKAYAYPPQWQF